MRLLVGAVVLLVSLGMASPADADIYLCKQRNGTLHFTNAAGPKRGCKLAIREKSRSRRSSKGGKAKPKAPRDRQQFHATIREAAELYQLPVPFILAVIHVESAFNPTVVSPKGAMGLMQLMPQTARSMGVEDAFNPRQNILGGSRYLRLLANRYDGDMVLTAAAYNAGENAVDKYGGIPPYKETQRYVRRVLKHYYAYRDSE